MNLSALLEDVLRISVEAGDAIMRVYGSADFGVTYKDDESPLTQADLAAHHLIIDALKALTPELPCLSEEAADISYDVRRAWPRYWLIDPLDGTREFVKRNGEFTVNIALIDRGTPILGVVHAPALHVSYLAAQGVGAFRVSDGQRTAIHSRKTPTKPSLVVSKSHRDAALDVLLSPAPAHDAVSRGSSLKFCLVAEGSADLYPRTGPTSEWDTGAGQCVAEQAGCEVYTLPDWQPLRYNQKASLLNPGFIVIGDPAFGWRQRLKLD
ncbi:MAG: 3'(2'),5'-bisphosphate nucleotidase CysQ [Stenotrophobium sp.]